MRFGYACAEGHEIEWAFPAGKAPAAVSCSDHGEHAARVFEAPYFVEDRRRMAAPTSNAPRPDWSWALGAPMPQTRSEMRAVEKMQGIEFVTRDEARRDVEKLRSGKNLDEPVKPEKGYVAREFAKRGIKIRDSAASPARQWTREESERKLAAERGWDANAEATVATPTKVPD